LSSNGRQNALGEGETFPIGCFFTMSFVLLAILNGINKVRVEKLANEKFADIIHIFRVLGIFWNTSLGSLVLWVNRQIPCDYSVGRWLYKKGGGGAKKSRCC
jgi:hypothetical protein